MVLINTISKFFSKARINNAAVDITTSPNGNSIELPKRKTLPDIILADTSRVIETYNEEIWKIRS